MGSSPASLSLGELPHGMSSPHRVGTMTLGVEQKNSKRGYRWGQPALVMIEKSHLEQNSRRYLQRAVLPEAAQDWEEQEPV